MSDPTDADYPLRRERRARARENALKALYLTNGGSAAALLAFLQSVWKPEASGLIECVIAALALLAASLPFIIWANFNEAEISLAYDEWAVEVENNPSYAPHYDKPEMVKKLERLRAVLIGISVGLFAAALAAVCIGAWSNLPA